MHRSAVGRHGEPPVLLGATARNDAFRLLKDGAKGEPLVVVAPGPVIAPETYEALVALGAGVIGPHIPDFESWRANPLSYLAFFELIAAWGPETCVILSGDVHFAHTALAKVTAGGQSFRVMQCTSSAMKNRQSGSTGAAILRALRTGFPLPAVSAIGITIPTGTLVPPPATEVRRLWWRIAGGETESLDHTTGGPIMDDLEESLRNQLGAPTLEEHVRHIDSGVSGQGTVLEFNNVGELRCAVRITSQLFPAAGGSGSSVSL